MAGKTDLAYTMSFEMLPKVEMIDFIALKLEREVVEVAEETIDKAIDDLVERRPYEAKGDRAQARATASRSISSAASTGRSSKAAKGEDMEIVIGRGNFIPGFEDGLGAPRPVMSGPSRRRSRQYPELPGRQGCGFRGQGEVRGETDHAGDRRRVGQEAWASRPGASAQGGRGGSERKMRPSRATAQAPAPRPARHGARVRAAGSAGRSEFDISGRRLTETSKRPRHVRGRGQAEENARPSIVRSPSAVSASGWCLPRSARSNKMEVSQEELRNALFEQARRYPGQERMVYEYFEKKPGASGELRAPIYEDKVVDLHHRRGQAGREEGDARGAAETGGARRCCCSTRCTSMPSMITSTASTIRSSMIMTTARPPPSRP